MAYLFGACGAKSIRKEFESSAEQLAQPARHLSLELWPDQRC